MSEKRKHDAVPPPAQAPAGGLCAALETGSDDDGVPQSAPRPQGPSLLTLADHLPDIIGRVDRQHRYVFINRVITDITGRSVAEYLGRTDEELGHPPALCRLWRRQYEAVFASGEPSEVTFAFESPRGVLLFSKRAVPELDADGAVAFVVFIARDVTALARAEAERLNHRRVLAAINRIFETLVGGQTEAAFAVACCTEARALTGSPLACLCELGPDGQWHHVSGTPPDHPGEVTDVEPLLAAVRGRVLAQDESVRFVAADTASAAASAPDLELLCVPLRYRGSVIGMLAVARRFGGYGPAEQDALEALAPAMAEALALRNAEEALRAGEERLRVLVEAAAQAVWETDAAGQGVADSPSFCAHRGQTLDQWLDQGWVDAVHPDEQADALRQWREAVAAGRNLDAEFRLRGPDGDWRWSNVRAAPVRDPGGRVQRWVGMNIDISARKDAQAALEAARQEAELDRKRLEAVLEATPLAVVLIDAATRRFLYLNRRALDLYGADYGGQDLASHANQLRVLRVDGTPCPMPEWPVNRSLASGEAVHQEEMAIRRADGVTLPVLLSSAPVRDCRGSLVAAVVVFDDITERKAAEAALLDLNQALEARVDEVSRQADQLRSLASQLSQVEQRERRRLARILHDHIQQLIVAAQMQSATLVREANTERQRATAGAVQDALAEALRVSRSLTVELSPPVLQETGLVGALDWLAGRMQEQHRFTVRLHADTRAEPDAEELRFLLFECARELLLNTVKHAGVGAADLLLLRMGDGSLELGVSDEGGGFDVARLSRRRADETSFGLFSIRERLAHLGGHMEIASAPGQGTQVTLRVPLGPGAAGTRSGGLEPVPTPGPQRGRDPVIRRLLIVDDHQILRQGLAGLFESEADIEVVGEAASGEQALTLAAGLRPDVVIMDVNLGEGIDGVEATRRLVAEDPGVRVIGLSMHLDSTVADAMRDAGAVAYLTKGGPCEELLAVIRNLGDD